MNLFKCLFLVLFCLSANAVFANQLADLPLPINGAGSVAVDGKMYIFGGHDGSSHLKTVFCYDPTQNTWEQKASMPNVAATSPAVGVIGGKIYVIGGGQGEPEIQIYNPQNDTWSLGAAIPRNRHSLSGTVLNNKLHVMCGDPWSGFAVADHHVYDPATNTWTTKASAPEVLSQPISIAFEGKIYLFGGLRTPTPPQNKMYIYDPVSNSWQQGPSMPRAGQYSNCSLFDGKAIILGGNDNDGAFGDVQCYSVASEEWSVLDNIDPPRRAAAAAIIGNNIYFCGGIDHNGNVLQSLHVYQLAQPPIVALADTLQCPNGEFWLDVKVGDASNPVTDLKVVSFELAYTNTEIIDYLAFENGSFLTNSSATVVENDAAGVISASVYKTSGGNSGEGVVLRLKFKINANAQKNQTVAFSFQEVQANNASGESITLAPGSLTIKIDYLLVWPGDANNDGLVSIFDINPIIALHWQKTGPTRPNASMSWKGQPCPSWTPQDATFTDCNGDGKVSIFDINPIVINFNKSHAVQNNRENFQGDIVSNVPQAGAEIKVVPREGYNDETKEFWVDIKVGSMDIELEDLKVVSFELSYTNTASIDYVGYDISANEILASSAQATVIADDDSGMISASVYQSNAGEDGCGTVLSLKMKGEFGTAFEMSFINVLANSSSG